MRGQTCFSSATAVIWLWIMPLTVWAEVDFNRDVRPILSDRCFQCHGPDAANQESEFRVDSFQNATADLGGYVGVQPGDLSASELHTRIHDEDDPMPPVGTRKPLSEREKDILDQWIQQGASYEAHWAFTPLPKTVSPPGDEQLGDLADWPHSEIDQFVAKQIHANSMTPAEPASKEKWLRRVTFDLTGLPPTLAEIDGYLSDESHAAEAKVVDRLLKSQACAERLTSEWLDVARYADSYGYQRDDERFVWPYRDWVIDAMRQNMPYDEFITWQLAGDLLPNATTEQRLATLFNRLHSHKKEGGVDIEEFRVENVADRTHTFGAAMLGLTMECCRCHDHKYDPISMKDYYSLSAFFDNIDENGLISYFTDAVPTPAMPLPNQEQASELDRLKGQLAAKEAAYQAYFANQASGSFERWLTRPEVPELSPGLLADVSFDQSTRVKAEKPKEDDRLVFTNRVGEDAVSSPANRLVEGLFGKAIQLTGDDPVEFPKIAQYDRHQAFSFSLWIWSPEVETRSVIVRRSRGWDDAGSIGYELTRQGDKLSAKLCHFWPGDAIAIETTAPLQAKRWYHVAVTYDGSSRAAGLKLFVDGEPADIKVVKDHLTRNISRWNDSYEKNDHYDLAIGSRYRDRGFVGGRVDSFRIWSRQISELEVAQSFDARSLMAALGQATDQLNDQQRQRLFEYFVLAVDPIARAKRDELTAARLAVNEHVDSIPAIMVMRETNTPRQTYLLERGVYNDRGQPVALETPAFLPPMPDDLPRNRLGLARWLTSPDHPLTARVAVNRYWQLMFGQGLVRTPEDFGNQGEMPTHPKLLDWLARDFVDSGWDVHRLLRKLALSATYRQSSIVSQSKRDRDPDNRLLARGSGTRLSAEMIRDNALAVSGLLVEKVGGPPVKPYDLELAYNPLKVDEGDKLYRRSLYTFWKRTSPAPVMMTLNTPTREVCRLKREITDTPLQALVMLNGAQFIEASRVLAANLLAEHGDGIDALASEAFTRLTSRAPSAEELDILVQLYREQLSDFTDDPARAEQLLQIGNAPTSTPELSARSTPELAAGTILVNSIMNLDECVRHQ